MPICGVVITCRADRIADVEVELQKFQPQLEIHGTDDKGHVVVVLDTESTAEMEHLIDNINKHEDILNVGMTYLNVEDEAEHMARGDNSPLASGLRNPAGSADIAGEDE